MSVSGHVGMRTVPGTAIMDAEPGISKTKPGRWKSSATIIEAQMHRCMVCGMIANYVWLSSWCVFASGYKQGARKRLAHRPCRGKGLVYVSIEMIEAAAVLSWSRKATPEDLLLGGAEVQRTN